MGMHSFICDIIFLIKKDSQHQLAVVDSLLIYPTFRVVHQDIDI